MHLFFDTVWKLHIGEIPEKPRRLDYWHQPFWDEVISKYNESIDTIKQNALTVGNAEILKQFGYLELPVNGDFFEWSGGYETKEIQDVVNYGYPVEDGISGTSVLVRRTVAILTLPEEKKNTMENLTKEQAAIKWLLDTLCPFENMEALGPLECFKIREIESLIRETTASGSVAAPKEDAEIIEDLEVKGARSFINENTALREALKELLTITETNVFNFNEYKAIIERARKLISK